MWNIHSFMCVCSSQRSRGAHQRQGRHQQLFRHHRAGQGEVPDVGEEERRPERRMARGMRTVSGRTDCIIQANLRTRLYTLFSRIPDRGNRAELVLTCLHKGSVVDDFLGQVTLPLNEMDVYERPRQRWFKLESKPGQEKKDKQRGELEVSDQNTERSELA